MLSSTQSWQTIQTVYCGDKKFCDTFAASATVVYKLTTTFYVAAVVALTLSKTCN